MLYTMERGTERWVPYGRYYVEGSKLLLTFTNGSRQIWYRQ